MMKKWKTYFMLFLLAAAVTQAELVDDFDGYSLGLVNDVTTKWEAGADNGTSPSTATIAVDPADSANKVIQLTEGGNTAQQWVRAALSPTAAIEQGKTATLFLRFRATEQIDSSFGLTDVDSPSTNWGDFRLQFVVHNAVQIRDGSSVRDLVYAATGAAVPWNTDWYYLWLVITNDPAAPVIKVYINQSGVDATEADRCVRADLPTQDTFGFRAAAAGALDRFFWRAQNNPNTRMVQLDDINITQGVDLRVPPMLRPYGPSVAEGTPVGKDIPTTLMWNAGADPAGVYAVNPAIVDQYIFLSSGKLTDPNLVYKGATGSDPGLTDPSSQFSFTGALDSTYYWAVVEALEGYEQVFSEGDSIDLVDPNNIIGPTWSYEAAKSLPMLTAQPADVRVFAADPSAVFTVQFTSAVNPVTVTWYKDDAVLTDGVGNVSIVTDPFTSSTLTIAAPTVDDEGKYYCKLSVQEGDADDIQSVTRLLVINKLLARYDFETNLDDTSGNSAPSGILKTVSLDDPNEVLAAVVASPVYTDGIQGQAISLDGAQFIDFGVEGYPKAGPLNTLGDVRGGGYEKQGFGRGMDAGSILCWVKPASDGCIYANANIADGTHFAVTVNGTTGARIIVRGENWDGGWQNLGEASGAYLMDEFNLQDGQWHMLAATWIDSTARIYVNGEEVANNTQGYTEVYKPWDLANILGASRQGQPNRHLLNPNDFVTGAVDSLRIYNYPLTAAEIADEYELLTGRKICVNRSFAGSEFNFDNTAASYCIVDLADFAKFAAAWLQNGLD